MGCYRLAEAIKNDLILITPDFKEYSKFIPDKYCRAEKNWRLSVRNNIIRRLLIRIDFIKKSKFSDIWCGASEEEYDSDIFKNAVLDINTAILDMYPKKEIDCVKRELDLEEETEEVMRAMGSKLTN